MTEMMSNIGNSGYYDWNKGLCVSPKNNPDQAAAKTSEKKSKQEIVLLPLPQAGKEFWQEVTEGLAGVLFSPFGCSSGKPVSSVCVSDPSPHGFVDNQKSVPAIYNPLDLEIGGKGIDLTWTMNIPNCDLGYDKQYLRVYLSADRVKFQDYFPDQTGQITVSQHFDNPNTYPSSLSADFYSYNPNTGKIADKPKAITLYTASVDPNAAQVQHVNDCFYSINPQPLTSGIISSVGSNVDFGQTVRFSALPRECDVKSFDDLNVVFMVDGNPVTPTKSTDGSGSFYIDYTFDKKDGNIAIAIAYSDTKRQSSTLEYVSSVYVNPTKYSVEIVPTSVNGFMAQRPVTLNAGFVSSVPSKDVTFSWEVRDPAGQLVTDQSGKQLIFPNSPQVDFIPSIDGPYSATLTISGDKFIKPVTLYKEVPVYPLSAPQLFPNGNQAPKSGNAVSYGLQLLPVNRQRGAEDDGATCTWKMSHIDLTSNKPVVDLASQVQNCSQPLSFTFPVISEQTSYLLEAKVVGGGNAYGISSPLSISIPIILYPDAVNQPQANFTVNDQGTPYPGREVDFSGLMVNSPAGAVLTYTWDITDKDGLPVTNQSVSSPNLAYSFAKSGPYTVKLSVFADGVTDPIATSEQIYSVYPFPKPGVKITINDNKPVFVGQQVILSGLLDRSLPEDQNAAYAWQISHRELDPATSQLVPVVDLGPAIAQARTRDLLYTFPDSRTYTVELTVTGSNGTSTVYTAGASAFLDVFLPSNGLPQAGFTNPTSAKSGDPVTFAANNPDETKYTYTWDFNDGSTPGTGASVVKTYTLAAGQITTYNVKLTVASIDDANTKSTATQSITIVGPQITSGSEPALKSFAFTPSVCQANDSTQPSFCANPAPVSFSLAVTSDTTLVSALIKYGDEAAGQAATEIPIVVTPGTNEYDLGFSHSYSYSGRTTRNISVDVKDSTGATTTVVPASSYQFNTY